MREQSRWSDQAIDMLRTLAASGTVYREIAREIRGALGIPFTRNAVCGKSFRLKVTNNIKEKPAPKKCDRRRRRAKSKNLSTALAFLARTPASEPAQPLPMDEGEAPQSSRKTILELTNSTCRWPIGNPRAPDFAYCGAPSADLNGKRPYCRVHDLMAWRPR